MCGTNLKYMLRCSRHTAYYYAAYYLCCLLLKWRIINNYLPTLRWIIVLAYIQYHNKTKMTKKRRNYFKLKTICFSAPVIVVKQNSIYTLLAFIRNSFKEHLYTLLNKPLWLSSCLAKPQLRLVQKIARL